MVNCDYHYYETSKTKRIATENVVTATRSLYILGNPEQARKYGRRTVRTYVRATLPPPFFPAAKLQSRKVGNYLKTS